MNWEESAPSCTNSTLPSKFCQLESLHQDMPIWQCLAGGSVEPWSSRQRSDRAATPVGSRNLEDLLLWAAWRNDHCTAPAAAASLTKHLQPTASTLTEQLKAAPQVRTTFVHAPSRDTGLRLMASLTAEGCPRSANASLPGP